MVSWGYHADAGFGERHGWQGTRDPAAHLVVSAAIAAHAGFDLEGMRRLANEAEERLARYGLRRLRGERAPFMRALTVPVDDPVSLAQRLYDDHRVEAPVYDWEETALLRVSVGPYTDASDLDRLVGAVRDTLG